MTASVRTRDGVILKVRRGTDAAAAALKALPGVEKVERADGELRVEWKVGLDLREAAARLAVEKDWGLLEMRPMAMTIEDIYLKIVSGGVEQ